MGWDSAARFARPNSKQFIEHMQFRKRVKNSLVDVTNFFWPSENFASSYSLASVTKIEGQPSYNGTNTAVLVSDTDAANTGYMQRGALPINADTNIYCLSAYVKQKTGDALQFRLAASTTSVLRFNFSTKLLVVTSGTAIAGGVREHSNGWFRVWFYFTNANATSIGSIRFYPTDGVAASLGEGYFDKLQLEIVPDTATGPSKYIATSTVAVTEKQRPG